jgi:phosphoribosyl 1,2-cyclic phosphodiesterase
MKMTVIASGSAGNCYVLEGRSSALILECGVPPERVMKGTDLRPSKVAGCLVTHEHGDHAGFVGRYLSLGLPVYASGGTCDALRYGKRMRRLHPVSSQMVGEFQVFSFPVIHDAAEPFGYIVGHPELGRLLFVTDARAVPYSFPKSAIDHIMVEANYSDRIVDAAVDDGSLTPERAARVRSTHMSLQGARELVLRNESASLKTVTLIHLSSQNSDYRAFKQEIQDAVLFAGVWTAHPGLTIEMRGRTEV